MSFGESRDADRKSAAVPDEPHQLVRILESAVGLLKVAGAARRIAAQRQDVGDAERPRLLEDAGGVVPRRVDARHVRHRGQSVLALDAIDDRQRLFAGAAAGAVGDRAEIRRQPRERRNRLFEQRPLAFRRLGRKKLEGNHRLLRAARTPAKMSRINRMCADILSQ